MQYYKTSDGKYIAAVYVSTKHRFRTNLTKDFGRAEASSVDDLKNVRKYTSIRGVGRAVKRWQDKLES